MINFYKPNSQSTGCAFGFRMGTQGKNYEPCVYMTAVKQYSWDSSKKTGSFSGNHKNPEKSLSVKFNETEISGFIYAVEKYEKFSAYHTFDDNSTSIMFSPYKKKSGEDAFSYTVTRNSSNKFGMGVEMSEAYLMCQFFKHALDKIFSYRIEANKK